MLESLQTLSDHMGLVATVLESPVLVNVDRQQTKWINNTCGMLDGDMLKRENKAEEGVYQYRGDTYNFS